MLDKQIFKKFNDVYWKLNKKEEDEIRHEFKIINVDWLSSSLVKSEMFTDEYFKKSPKKEEIVNNILDYYLNHEDKAIYKKTDYLCNQQEKICICNVHAEDFRKIYDKNNYKQGDKYISWFNVINNK